jgi:hypothetical protein
MITKREQEERLEVMQNALASLRLEGLDPGEEAIAESEKWTRGEVEIRDVIENFIAKVKCGEIRG